MTAIVLLAALVTTITTLSMSAICTNGEVKGGMFSIFAAKYSICCSVCLFIHSRHESVRTVRRSINLSNKNKFRLAMMSP